MAKNPDQTLGLPAAATAEASARDFLAQIFPHLGAGALSALLASARLVRHGASATLCNEGEIEHCFYVLVEGSVDVFRIFEGQRLLINQLHAGAHFGEIALLLDVPRTTSIVTAGPVLVLEVDDAIFAQLLKINPEIVVALSQLVVQRFLVQEQKHLLEIARLKKRDLPTAQVFLSYSRVDEAFVTRLANDLLKHGIEVWLDVFRLEPGTSWARQIGESLDSCQVMLLVLSPTSVGSENVDDEWNYYLDQKKPVVTVLHQPCKVPYRLSKLQYVDFHDQAYALALARLVVAFNTLR